MNLAANTPDDATRLSIELSLQININQPAVCNVVEIAICLSILYEAVCLRSLNAIASRPY
jgi:hypothetical protein